MRRTKLFACLLLLLLLQTACAGMTGSRKPDWIMKPPKDPANLVYVGIASGAPSLDQGQNMAIKNAMSQISDFLGVRIESVEEQHITEIEQHLKHQITSKSKAKVQGAQVADWFYEEQGATFDVYVLVKFPKSQVGKELARQKREQSQKTHTAHDLYLSGRESEQAKKYKEAKDHYSKAREILQGLDDIVSLNRDGIKNSHNLLALVDTGLQNVASASRRLSLALEVQGPAASDQAFRSNLSAALGEKGYTVSREDAPIEISGSVSVSESGFVMNNYVFFAEGSVSALRKSDGQIIGTVPFRTKAFGASKEKAALKALAGAGSEAGENLVKILQDNE